MFEIESGVKHIDRIQFISKTIFDVIRNTLIVATIGYFYQKNPNVSMTIIYALVQGFLGAYIASLFLNIRFTSKFFSDTWEGKSFRLTISLAAAFIVSMALNYATASLVKEAIAAQVRQQPDTRCSFIP